MLILLQHKLDELVDSIRTVGLKQNLDVMAMPDGTYKLGTQPVYVKNGEARLANGALAGSIANMNDCVRNAFEHLGLTLNEAVNLASYNPAQSLGEPLLGEIKEGKFADIIFFSHNISAPFSVTKATLLSVPSNFLIFSIMMYCLSTSVRMLVSIRQVLKL